MSKIKALQDYFEQFDGIEILTQSDKGESIALFPTGNSSPTFDTIGNRYYSRSYQMLFKKPAFEESARQANYSWLEDLCDWAEDKVENQDFPDFGEGYRVQTLTLANIQPFDADESFSLVVYSVQINITYYKEV